MLSRLWNHRVKLLRFAGVSVVALVVTQSTLLLCKGILDWPGVTSNIVAVCLAAVPAYLLNRRWVWRKNGRHSVRGEIVPFWTYNLVGLVFSTALVALADSWWGTTWSVLAANLVGFGALWIGKFLFLEKVLFGAPRVAAPETV